MNATVPEKILDLLKQIVTEDLSEYSIDAQYPNKKGEGYMGEVCFVDLQKKTSGEVLNFVVKQAFSGDVIRRNIPVRGAFLNEIYFYTKVWTRYQNFQEEVLGRKIFDKFPKCIYTDVGDNSEKLVLENLKCQGFEVKDKKAVFDKEHVEFIMREYGKFHAISFCFKELRPKGYLELAKGLREMYLECFQNESSKNLNNGLHKLCLGSLQPGKDNDVINKYKHYAEDGYDIFINTNDYKGKYSVILQWDCNSGNMLFKYNQSKQLVDMRFLDFQFARQGTPVSDISYALYSGGSKEIFSDLDHYLLVYHNSLSETIRAFGCDPEELYPFKALQDDWQHYCRMGFIMGLMLWKGKLTYESEVRDFTDMAEDGNLAKYLEGGFDEETFKERTRDLIMHMYERDFL